MLRNSCQLLMICNYGSIVWKTVFPCLNKTCSILLRRFQLQTSAKAGNQSGLCAFDDSRAHDNLGVELAIQWTQSSLVETVIFCTCLLSCQCQCDCKSHFLCSLACRHLTCFDLSGQQLQLVPEYVSIKRNTKKHFFISFIIFWIWFCKCLLRIFASPWSPPKWMKESV